MPVVVSSAGTLPLIKRSKRPDIEVRRLLLQLSPVGLANMSKLTVKSVRRSWQLCVKAFASRESVDSVVQDEIDCGSHSLPVRIYRSEQVARPQPVLLWYHGGGFVFGDLYTAGATCRAIASRTDAIVIAVDYRLLPEHRFSDARSDCLKALLWAEAHVGSIGGDPSRIAVGGDSAGGTLAALAVLDSVRMGRPIAMMQLLVYPACDLSRGHHRSPDRIEILTSAHFEWLRSRIAEVSDLREPTYSPLRHELKDGMPMTVLLTAGFDPLRDEGLEYGQKLAKARVPLQVLHYPGQFHGFLSFDRVLAGARDALDRLAAALQQGFDSKRVAEGTESISIPGLQSMRKVMFGLHPIQRVRETWVAGILFKEAVAKGLRRKR